MERKKKEAQVEALKETFQTTEAVFVADFKGIPMESMSSLRAKVKQANAKFQVSKNTLMKLAAKDTNVEKLDALFVGNNAISYTSADAAALAKVVCDFAKENDKFVIKGGVLGDQTISYAQIKALAALPSKEALLSSLLGTMQAVPGNFVRTMAAIPQKLLYALSAIKDQKSA